MENFQTQMKTRSIRADESVLERFKALSEEFPNQSEALNSIITAWETQNAKVVLHGLETDISDFELHLQNIQKSYLHILELNQNAEKRIRLEFQQQIESKDKIITDLQSVKETLEHKLQRSEETIASVQTDKSAEMAMLSEKIVNLEQQISASVSRAMVAEKASSQAEQLVSDKQTIIETLNKRLAEATESSIQVTETKEALLIITKEKDSLQSRVDALEAKIVEQEQKYTEQIALVKERAELATDRAVYAEREKFQIKFEKILEQNNQLVTQIADLRTALAEKNQ